MKKGKLFGYVQCDIEVPENLRSTFINFASMFKNTLVSKSVFGDLMKNYAEEEKLVSQPRKTLISSFTLQKGNIYYSSANVLLTTGSCLQKNTRLCQVHSNERFQQFCADSSGRKKAR